MWSLSSHCSYTRGYLLYKINLENLSGNFAPDSHHFLFMKCELWWEERGWTKFDNLQPPGETRCQQHLHSSAACWVCDGLAKHICNHIGNHESYTSSKTWFRLYREYLAQCGIESGIQPNNGVIMQAGWIPVKHRTRIRTPSNVLGRWQWSQWIIQGVPLILYSLHLVFPFLTS